MKRLLTSIFLYLRLAFLIGVSAFMHKKYNWLLQKNPIEEAIEVVMKKTAGVDVDLSQETGEK